jgi:hypothetical protein
MIDHITRCPSFYFLFPVMTTEMAFLTCCLPAEPLVTNNPLCPLTTPTPYVGSKLQHCLAPVVVIKSVRRGACSSNHFRSTTKTNHQQYVLAVDLEKGAGRHLQQHLPSRLHFHMILLHAVPGMEPHDGTASDSVASAWDLVHTASSCAALHD